jgi:hypothetical protein
MNDYGEDIRDLDRPVVAGGNIGRCLDHRRLDAEVGKARAIGRVIVRCYDQRCDGDM